MRRKSERASGSRKIKNSPEKKIEKPKRSVRTRRRKQSVSSDNESADESSPVTEVEIVDSNIESKEPILNTIEDAAAEDQTQEQVWQVKTAEGSGDGGEIKKLKICLTRPPSTPEMAEVSPHSKRKHSRTTSSSDTPSTEGGDERKKKKHHSKRSTRELKDDQEKNADSHDDSEMETKKLCIDESESNQKQKDEESTASAPHSEIDSTSNKAMVEDVLIIDQGHHDPLLNQDSDDLDQGNNASDSHNDMDQSKNDMIQVENETNRDKNDIDQDKISVDQDKITKDQDKSVIDEEKRNEVDQGNNKSPSHQNIKVVEFSHIISQNEVTSSGNDVDVNDADCSDDLLPIKSSEVESCEIISSEKLTDKQGVTGNEDEENLVCIDSSKAIEEAVHDKVSNNDHKESISQANNECKASDSDVLDISLSKEKIVRNISIDSSGDKEIEVHGKMELDLLQSDSGPSNFEESTQNSGAPIVVNRKRRWGSRPTKILTQKSITISTDILKEIIPDVKPVELDEIIEEKKQHKRVELPEKVDRPVLPKIVIDNTEHMEVKRNLDESTDKENFRSKDAHLGMNRKISIVKESDNIIIQPPSPPKHKQSNILFITNLVRPFTLLQLKNLLQRTGRIVEDGFWIDRIKSKCFVKYEREDQAVETRHALHGVTWPVSNPKTLHVDFSTPEEFDKAKASEVQENVQTSTAPGTVEDWIHEQDVKRERGDSDKPWERRTIVREWDVGKNGKDKEKDKFFREDHPMEKTNRRHRTPERSPEPARKFKRKEEEAPAKMLDDLFKKTKSVPCIYWLPLSAETIAIKEEQRRKHMAEHERRMQEHKLRGSHRRH